MNTDELWGKTKDKIKKLWAYVKDRKNWFRLATTIIFLVLLGFEIFWLKDDIVSVFKSQVSWVSLGTILGVILLIVLWIKSPIKKIFGEGKGISRSHFHITLNYILIFLFLLPFELYFLKGSLYPQVEDYLAGLGIIGVSITLSGLMLASARISQITPNKRQELVCVSQKFIMTAVFVILAIVSIFTIDKGLNGIAVNTIAFSEPTNYYRGLLFWIAAPCFHGSFILFIIGLSDLVFVFLDLDTRPTIPRQ